MRKLSILLLAADSGEGPLGELIDPALREAWKREGVHTSACYVSSLRLEHLDHVHVVILLRTPIPAHAFQDEPVFAEKSVWLRDFVEAGGGLLTLFTECYGKTEFTLNKFFEPWGLRFYFNRLVPQPGVAIERFPRFFEGLILPALTQDGELGIITEGGHGTQHLTCSGDARWQPLLRGGSRIVSEPYRGAYSNGSDTAIRDPVLAARAEIGQGRVVAFPGSAPFWIVNPFIWRFGGLLHKQRDGAGSKFLLAAIFWLAETARAKALRPDFALLPDATGLQRPELFSFQRVRAEHQKRLRQALPQKIWIGSPPVPSGYQAAFPLVDYRQLNEAIWPDYMTAGRASSTPETQVIPGYDLLDDEGVHSAVISPDVFPKHDIRYPNSTLLESVWVPLSGCVSILREPLNNRIPPQRYGGYNLIEWDPSSEWGQLYGRLVASKYFIAPIAFAGAETWALVPADSTAFDEIRRNRHSTFVTNGPRLQTFAWEGDGLTDDDWEGYWYGYRPGDEAIVHLRVEADAPLVEVVLRDGENVLQTFETDGPVFAARLTLVLQHDLSLHVTARDSKGRELFATYPLYTRNLEFWGHVGSDQMNNYVNALKPSPRGFLGMRGELWEMFGFVTFGAGWGDYIRITPSIRYSEFMPRQEISLILGSFNLHHPSALLHDGSRLRYLNDHRRVFGYCGPEAQRYRSEIAGEHVDNDEGATETWHGRAVRPTRAFRAVPGFRGYDDYIVWRWQEGSPIVVEVRKHFEVAQRLLAGEWLTFASNAHHLLPGLRVRSGGSQKMVADLPEAPAGVEPHKEWDNSHYLRGGITGFDPLDFADCLEIGHGGVGTFALFALGPDRNYRCLLQRQPRELTVFFQTRLLPEERANGRFTIAYLLVVAAEDEKGLAEVRNAIRLASSPEERRYAPASGGSSRV